LFNISLNFKGATILALERVIKTKQLGEVQMQYVYQLVQGEYNNQTAYGIKVERNEILQGEIIDTVSEEVRIISNVRDKVMEIIDKLSFHQVSPIHLIDIIGEDVDKCVFDF
jgi:hypothetical protein